jgi:16S rRNA (cytidine1402-2'-O)-methyltransferase
MPGLSDPGARVVTAAANAGVAVDIVPGPDAAVTALVVSGLPAERFCFEGFLPRKGAPRSARLSALASEDRTSVIYEAPRRVAATLADLAAACGADRRAVAARELTKIHQEVRRSTLGELAVWAGAHEPRGEWVLVVAGATAVAATDAEILETLAARLDAGEGRRDAVDAVAAAFGTGRRRVYQLALRL